MPALWFPLESWWRWRRSGWQRSMWSPQFRNTCKPKCQVQVDKAALSTKMMLKERTLWLFMSGKPLTEIRFCIYAENATIHISMTQKHREQRAFSSGWMNPFGPSSHIPLWFILKPEDEQSTLPPNNKQGRSHSHRQGSHPEFMLLYCCRQLSLHTQVTSAIFYTPMNLHADSGYRGYV